MERIQRNLIYMKREYFEFNKNYRMLARDAQKNEEYDWNDKMKMVKWEI